MKVKVEWKQEVEGVSEVEVDEADVATWLNEWSKDKKNPEDVTPEDCFDFLQSGDDDVWAEQIDVEQDSRLMPWNDLELERLHRG